LKPQTVLAGVRKRPGSKRRSLCPDSAGCWLRYWSSRSSRSCFRCVPRPPPVTNPSVARTPGYGHDPHRERLAAGRPPRRRCGVHSGLLLRRHAGTGSITLNGEPMTDIVFWTDAEIAFRPLLDANSGNLVVNSQSYGSDSTANEANCPTPPPDYVGIFAVTTRSTQRSTSRRWARPFTRRLCGT